MDVVSGMTRYREAVEGAPAALKAALRSGVMEPWRALWRLRGRVVVVGSGGSYAAAVMMADALDRGATYARAMRPWEFLARGCQADAVVVVSHSGETQDALAVAKAAGEVGVRRFLVTNNVDSSCPREVGVWTGSWGEKCFLSVASTVVPVALLLANDPVGAPVGLEVALEAAWREGFLMGQRSRLLDRLVRKVSLVAGGYAMGAGIDAESRLVESAGADAVVLHELKDLSHGRWNMVLGHQHAVVVFVQPSSRPVWEAMAPVVQRHCETVVFEAPEGVVGALEQTCAFQGFHMALGEVSGRDWGRPRPLPEGGPDLYRIRHEVLLAAVAKPVPGGSR